MTGPVVDSFDDVIPATERGGYLVSSVSQPGAWWLVQVFPGRLECPCPRGRQITNGQALALSVGGARLAQRVFCRHGKRLLAFTAAQDAANRRPTAPANVAGLVD